MKYASLGPIAIHLPAKVETNQLLAAEFPQWNMEAIFAKTGIRSRPIADRQQCPSDLGVAAAEKLFAEYAIDRGSIDFLLFCTQTPDYPLPTTACLVQDRLGLPTAIGALDFNLGCSGFVYGLSLADGLIRSGSARRVLLITAETYSRYIDAADRSLRPIFADGAAATLVDAAGEPSLGHFVFGTDGRGGDALMVAEGGARAPGQSLQPKKRRRWPSSLYMDGPELVRFTLDVVPPMVQRLLADSRLRPQDVDFYLMHQATLFMLEHLRVKLSLEADSVPSNLEERGNTVSSTLPILIHDLRNLGRLRPGKQSLLIGFGVGLSWAGCTWKETWQARQLDALGGQRREAA
jgi:3-oxoacyl-[acyl-carrier-protein] synthase-3